MRILLLICLLAPISDSHGCTLTGEQEYCYRYCQEQLEGKATMYAENGKDFEIEGGYCKCTVKVQLPVKLPIEKEEQ